MWRKFKRWLNEPDPEGLTGKDGLFMFFGPLLAIWFFMNLSIWLAEPTHPKLDKVLYTVICPVCDSNENKIIKK